MESVKNRETMKEGNSDHTHSFMAFEEFLKHFKKFSTCQTKYMSNVQVLHLGHFEHIFADMVVL